MQLQIPVSYVLLLSHLALGQTRWSLDNPRPWWRCRTSTGAMCEGLPGEGCTPTHWELKTTQDSIQGSQIWHLTVSIRTGMPWNGTARDGEHINQFVLWSHFDLQWVLSENRVLLHWSYSLIIQHLHFLILVVIIKSIISTFPTCLRISPMLIQYN